MKRPLCLAVALLLAIAAPSTRADDANARPSAPALLTAQAAPSAAAPSAAAPSAAAPSASAPSAGEAAADRKRPAADHRAAPKIDLNSASEDTLATLRGIGPARAKAIVDGRPYRTKDELVRRKIVPHSVYNGIKDRIIAKQGTQ